MNSQWIHSGSSDLNGNENDVAKGLDTLRNNNGNIIIGNTHETNNGLRIYSFLKHTMEYGIVFIITTFS